MKRLLVIALVIGAALLFAGGQTMADHDNGKGLEGYHYAQQWTSTQQNRYDHGDMDVGVSFYPNFNWTGANGYIKTPTWNLPENWDSTNDHVMGFLAVAFADGSYLQVGIFTGRVGFGPCPSYPKCIWRTGDFGLYMEYVPPQGPSHPNYWIGDFGTVPLGTGLKIRVEDSTSPDYWKIFIDDEYQFSFYIPDSKGEASVFAAMEIYDSACGVSDEDCDTMPKTGSWRFGGDAANSYQLRLRSGTTWEPWDTSLSDGYTSFLDQRDEVGVRTYLEHTTNYSGINMDANPCDEAWYFEPGDYDCDGFKDVWEIGAGTDRFDNCPDYSTDDAWPGDMAASGGYGLHDGKINILDIVQLTDPYFGTCEGQPNYSARRDIVHDGCINILDIVRLSPPMYGESCQ